MFASLRIVLVTHDPKTCLRNDVGREEQIDRRIKRCSYSSPSSSEQLRWGTIDLHCVLRRALSRFDWVQDDQITAVIRAFSSSYQLATDCRTFCLLSTTHLCRWEFCRIPSIMRVWVSVNFKHCFASRVLRFTQPSESGHRCFLIEIWLRRRVNLHF